MIVFRPEGPGLSVAVGGRRFALAAAAVRRVDAASPLTLLPFAPDWIEGLASVGGRPVLQIDPVRRLDGAGRGGRGGTGDKLLVLDTAVGAVALRVERVEAAAGPAPPLPVEALIAGLAASSRGDEGAPPAASGDEPTDETPAIVLVVASGAARIGILIDEGVSVGEVAASRRLDADDGSGPLMAIVGGRLLPARRLWQQGGAGRAVIGPAADGWTALLVERLIGLERVAVDRLVALPGAAAGGSLCFPMAGGDAVRLHDFATLAGDVEAVGAAYRLLLERVRNRREQTPLPHGGTAGDGGGGGLTVSVRGMRWLLPLALVERMLGIDEIHWKLLRRT